MPYLYRAHPSPRHLPAPHSPSPSRFPPRLFFLFLPAPLSVASTAIRLRLCRSPLTSSSGRLSRQPRIGMTLPALRHPLFPFYFPISAGRAFPSILVRRARQRGRPSFPPVTTTRTQSGAIKSALIAAPDNSIPRVKIIGQERDGRTSVGSPCTLHSPRPAERIAGWRAGAPSA